MATENPKTKSCRCISQWRNCFVLNSCIVSPHHRTPECETTKPVDICSPIRWARLLLGSLPRARNVSTWSALRAFDGISFPSKNPETTLHNKYFSFNLVKRSAMYWLLFLYYNNQNSCMRQKKELFWLCLLQNRYKKIAMKIIPQWLIKIELQFMLPNTTFILRLLRSIFSNNGWFRWIPRVLDHCWWH